MSEDRIEPTFKSIDLDDDKIEDSFKSLDDEINSLEKEVASTAPDDKKDVKKKDEKKKKDKNREKDSSDSFDTSDLSMKAERDDKDAEPDTGSVDQSQFEYRSSAKSEYDERYNYASDSDSTPGLFSLSGRMDRLRAAMFFLGATYISLALMTFMDPVMKMLSIGSGSASGLALDPMVYLVVGAVTWIVGVAFVAIKRLRDTNRTPFWSVLLLVPLVNILILYFTVTPTVDDDNEYGPPNAPYTMYTWMAAAIIFALIPLLIWINYESIANYFWNLAKIHNVPAGG